MRMYMSARITTKLSLYPWLVARRTSFPKSGQQTINKPECIPQSTLYTLGSFAHFPLDSPNAKVSQSPPCGRLAVSLVSRSCSSYSLSPATILSAQAGTVICCEFLRNVVITDSATDRFTSRLWRAMASWSISPPTRNTFSSCGCGVEKNSSTVAR